MTAQDSLTLQLLDWLAEKPRSYADIMEAWKTTCPRFTIWEDACDSGFVERQTGDLFGLSLKGSDARRRSSRTPAVR